MNYVQKRKFKYYGSIITLSALGFLKFYNATNEQYTREVSQLFSIELNAIDVQYYFKRQVQEWKNILLRGHISKDYEKYEELFSEEFIKTQAAAEKLNQLIANDSEAKPIANRFIYQHKTILSDYKSALEAFQNSNFNAKLADSAVRGIDREPTQLLDEISYIITQEVSLRRQLLEKELDHILLSTGLGFVSLQGLLCWVLVRLTDKLLKANISDKSTGVGNRELFVESIGEAIKSNQKASVMLLDIDNFKLINEAFGNKGGDKYLKEIAGKLNLELQAGDVLCRVSGDVLGIVSYCRDNIESESLVNRLLTVIRAYEHKNDLISISLTASAGMFCMHRAQEADVEHLLNKVYASLQEAKEIGPNSVVTYFDDNKHLVFRQQQMRKVIEIIKALKDNRIALFKQQIRPVDDNSHRTYHEILLRVIDEQGNVQGPGLFLQSAERFHLMDKIDRYVLASLVEYLEQHPEDDSYYTVNLSGNTLSDKSFIDFVEHLFRNPHIRYSHIGFEITETNIIKNFENASAVLNKLAGYHCKISLDDFGTGMSSYSYISQLSIDTLKIDGTFIKGIHSHKYNQAIVRSIVKLAKELNIDTVAEFIETEEELTTVKLLQVDYVQGYLLHKPEFMHRPDKLLSD